MKRAEDLIPWKVTDISFRPYDDFWSFNPSVLFDGSQWLCVLRCSDYAMFNGVTVRSKKAGPGHQTKNAMIVLDPTTWQPIKIFKMHERDNYPRVHSANVGYEDMRIFRTDRGGLQGIAASLHLARDKHASGTNNQPPEQVLLSFDDEYNIVKARPIRGEGFSSNAQKNWVPFNQAAEPRFLYSIDRGTLFGDHGPLHGDEARVIPSALSPSIVPIQTAPVLGPSAEDREREEREKREEQERREHEERRERSRDLRTRVPVRGTDVAVVRGRRVAVDSLSSRPSAIRRTTAVRGESTRVLGTGRALPPRYPGLRGGSQLIRVGDDAWLGIGHEMRFVEAKKMYWHLLYLVNDRGKTKSMSEPFKLVSNGIEFAAGMAIDGDRVVVSFGVDDGECKLGETSLSAVMERLRPV